MIDFIIPCHPKDFSSLKLTIDGICKNITCCRRILVISNEDPQIDGTFHINEKKYEKYITLDRVEKLWTERNINLVYRSKWIYQQFIKLLSTKVINDLTNSFVIVDADTIFLRDISFDSKKFFYLKNPIEYHKPYLKPIKKLLAVENTIGFSTISHHAIFNKHKLNKMIREIEKRFNNNLVDIILDIIDYDEASCFSEWDLYSNYMILNYPKLCVHRQLIWDDISFIPTKSHLEEFKDYYDFVCCHAYRRGIE